MEPNHTVMEKHHQHQKHRENDVHIQKESDEFQLSSPTTTSSSSSSTSSPSHDFSFTVSLHSSSSITTPPNSSTTTNKSTTPPYSTANSFALDLSPADDIFFHGHLLPLHLLSHLPSQSPRSSTNSMDSFTLPISSTTQDYYEKPIKQIARFREEEEKKDNLNSSSHNIITNGVNINNQRKPKSKSFSLFGLTRGRNKVIEEKEDKENQNKKKMKQKKLRFDVIHVVKRYLRMVQPLMSNFRGRRERDKIGESNYNSYSGNLSLRNKPELVKGIRRGEYSSAPASMRTSPTNSGLLLPTMTLPPPSDSTMEELQAAIQAAIAHCKNSIAKEDNKQDKKFSFV